MDLIGSVSLQMARIHLIDHKLLLAIFAFAVVDPSFLTQTLLIANELSSSIVINGDALDEEILKEANLEGSETVLALTNDDENNMMACVLAEKTGHKKRTIAIVNKTNYNLLQDSLNIDDLVDPRMTTVSRIMEHVHRGTIGTVYSLLDGEYEFIEAKILEKSELLNKKIRDSNLIIFFSSN